MDTSLFSLAEDFIWKNARLLEKRIFAYFFLGGSAREVVSALKAYQNPDGGFGNALEPDKRCPGSTPVDVQHALEFLDQVGMLTDPAVQAELLLPACDFLTSITTAEGGVPFTLPEVKRYPCAPWWETGENPPAALNPTAAIAGLLIKSGVQHPWVERAKAFCWKEIPASQTEQYHDLLPMIAFLVNAPEREDAERELERIAARIHKPGIVAYDRTQAGYLKFPLDWAPNPCTFCRRLFSDEVIQADLAALKAAQMPDGGWPIGWTPVSPAVEAEWRGWGAVQNLVTLKEYGALENA
jgi:hypothetical protein